ncbi:GHKL domain-containing protein [Pedobacter sp. HMF7647]|uniref:histidine kinase n=1 Tax=Hufsiella arboris TaxID=2695275 RepID=A0A7K1Y6E3_9SPHI|nr:ATP-binding protein [Hufsiella arboris]MXV49689.1 GHKL domain-containing protein [Hufsiella arboris]
MQSVGVSWLGKIEILKDVPYEQLQWFLDNSVYREFRAGEFLFEPGDTILGTHIMITGKVRLYIYQGNNKRELVTYEAGSISGYLPYSRGKIAAAYGEFITDGALMTFPIEKIPELVKFHFELTQALVHMMTNRVREYTAFQQQNEKMMALGKLSAGLAHELNNPAAAIVRDSHTLKKHLRLQPEAFKDVISIRMDAAQVDAVNNELFKILNKEKPAPLTLMQRSRKEDELDDWFEDHAVANAEELAGNFVEFGFNLDDLEGFSRRIPAAHLSPILNWMNNNLVTEKIVMDIEEASNRISQLVSSVKTFTHMDQASDKQLTDIHTGIKNTITMLSHKLRKNNISLVEDYGQEVPKIMALVGELNQVWTNIIDNAIDALEPNKKGTITIKTRLDGEFIEITITDDGPGIPAEIQSRIYDPFFTTKEIGKGTGMGLEVVHRIINQHRGTIKFKSIPGQTSFIICLPVNSEKLN